MVATETAKTVLLVLFGASILWIVIIIVKNDMETMVRALLIAAVVGAGLFLVGKPGASIDGKISLTSIREYLFPVRERTYTFDRREETIDGRPATTYIFHDPGPRLSLALMDGGKYMAIKDIRSVNSVLKFLGLPPVTEGVPELASLTGKRNDADKYRWDGYERGVLIIERSICRDMTTTESFPCIATLKIAAR